MREILDKVIASEATKERWRHSFNSEEFKNASRVNMELFGIPLNRSKKCQCIEDLFFSLKNPKIIKRLMSKQNQKFKIKDDKHISLHIGVFTAKSSDEQIIKLLKKHPEHVVNLERCPDNWREIVFGEAQEEETEEGSEVQEVEEVEESTEEDQEESEGYNEQELMSLKNSELKKIITDDLGLELPEKTNKASLVETILKA